MNAIQNISITTSGAVLLSLLSGCHGAIPLERDAIAADSGGESKEKVDVAEVTQATLRRIVDVPASFEGFQQAALVARIEGHVSDVSADIGAEKQQGDTLATLHVPELNAEVEHRVQLVLKAREDTNISKQQVEQARSRLGEQEAMLSLRVSEQKRAEALVSRGALTREKLEEAQYSVKAIEAAVERCQADVNVALAMVKGDEADEKVAQSEEVKARAMVSYATITAPFDGLITARTIHPGAFVEPAGAMNARPLFEIEQIDKMRVVLFLPMEDAGYLNDGDAVTLHEVEGLLGQRLRRTITRHARAFDRGSRMMRAEVDVENPVINDAGERKYRPGLYGTATVELAEMPNIPTIPISALGEGDDGLFVMVVGQDGVCTRRSVKVGITQDEVAGITEGLQVSERVVAKKPEDVAEGTTLRTAQQIEFKFKLPGQ